MPLASIVIPVWNRADTLGRAITSVLAQTEPDLEVVVVDNGSDDPESVGTTATDLVDDRVRLVRSDENLGPSGGRNLGIDAANGQLIGFLDSDDELEPEWLAALAAPFADQLVAAVTCGYRVIAEDGAASDVGHTRPQGPAFGGVTGCFQAGTMLVRADVVGRLQGFDGRLWFGENTDLGLRLSADARANGMRLVAVDEPLLRWHRSNAREYTQRRLEAAELMLDEHAAALAVDRTMLISHLAIAGRMAAQLGQFDRARGHFWTLMLRQPRVKNASRLVAASIPLLARRVWRAA